MTATYNPAEVERLVREAREDDARMTSMGQDGDWIADRDAVVVKRRPRAEIHCNPTNALAIARTRNNLRAMADQLEAAREMADRVPDLQAAIGYEIEKRDRFERERNTARTEADQLRARVAELERSEERLRGAVKGAGAAMEALERACLRVCKDTDWCPVCEQNPSTGHRADCLLLAPPTAGLESGAPIREYAPTEPGRRAP